MDQADLVHRRERRRDLGEDLERVRGLQRAVAQDLLERLPVHQLHGEVVDPLVAFPDVEEARAVLVHDGRRPPRFGQQRAPILGALREAGMEELERDRHERADVLGAEHRPEPAAAQHRLQTVLAVDDGAEERVGRVDLTAARGKVQRVGRQQQRAAVAAPLRLGIGHPFARKAGLHGIGAERDGAPRRHHTRKKGRTQPSSTRQTSKTARSRTNDRPRSGICTVHARDPAASA